MEWKIIIIAANSGARAHNIRRENNSRRRADQLVFLNLIEISMWDDVAGAAPARAYNKNEM